MKRFTAILLTGMMIFTLASCGKKAQDTPTEPATETQAAQKVEMLTETEAVTEVVTEAAKETQQTETQQTEAHRRRTSCFPLRAGREGISKPASCARRCGLAHACQNRIHKLR